jgi:hypothetical protein
MILMTYQTDRLRCYTAISSSNIRLESFQLSALHPLDHYSLTSCCCIRRIVHECYRRVNMRSCDRFPVQAANALECAEWSAVY